MVYLLAALGVALLALTCIDMFKTVLTLRGAGPVTARTSSWVWAGLLATHRRFGAKRLLSYGGPAIALATVLGWLLLQWAGWTLVFSTGSSAVVASQTGEPADLWARIYYVGYTLSTLGLGDYTPQGALWQALTPICAASGFMTFSLSATYLIPVVSAAAKKRETALYISSLGERPGDILLNGWNGQDFSALEQNLSTLGPMIIEIAEQHLAYPILHYFRSTDEQAALALRVAALDEALHLLWLGVAPGLRPHRAVVAPLGRAIEAHLRYMNGAYIRPADRPPPAPGLAALRAEGVPVLDDGAFLKALAERQDRRRLTLALVENAGWSWRAVQDDVSGCD